MDKFNLGFSPSDTDRLVSCQTRHWYRMHLAKQGHFEAWRKSLGGGSLAPRMDRLPAAFGSVGPRADVKDIVLCCGMDKDPWEHFETFMKNRATEHTSHGSSNCTSISGAEKGCFFFACDMDWIMAVRFSEMFPSRLATLNECKARLRSRFLVDFDFNEPGGWIHPLCKNEHGLSICDVIVQTLMFVIGASGWDSIQAKFVQAQTLESTPPFVLLTESCGAFLQKEDKRIFSSLEALRDVERAGVYPGYKLVCRSSFRFLFPYILVTCEESKFLIHCVTESLRAAFGTCHGKSWGELHTKGAVIDLEMSSAADGRNRMLGSDKPIRHGQEEWKCAFHLRNSNLSTQMCNSTDSCKLPLQRRPVRFYASLNEDMIPERKIHPWMKICTGSFRGELDMHVGLVGKTHLIMDRVELLLGDPLVQKLRFHESKSAPRQARAPKRKIKDMNSLVDIEPRQTESKALGLGAFFHRHLNIRWQEFLLFPGLLPESWKKTPTVVATPTLISKPESVPVRPSSSDAPPRLGNKIARSSSFRIPLPLPLPPPSPVATSFEEGPMRKKVLIRSVSRSSIPSPSPSSSSSSSSPSPPPTPSHEMWNAAPPFLALMHVFREDQVLCEKIQTQTPFFEKLNKILKERLGPLVKFQKMEVYFLGNTPCYSIAMTGKRTCIHNPRESHEHNQSFVTVSSSNMTHFETSSCRKFAVVENLPEELYKVMFIRTLDLEYEICSVRQQMDLQTLPRNNVEKRQACSLLQSKLYPGLVMANEEEEEEEGEGDEIDT